MGQEEQQIECVWTFEGENVSKESRWATGWVRECECVNLCDRLCGRNVREWSERVTDQCRWVCDCLFVCV